MHVFVERFNNATGKAESIYVNNTTMLVCNCHATSVDSDKLCMHSLYQATSVSSNIRIPHKSAKKASYLYNVYNSGHKLP